MLLLFIRILEQNYKLPVNIYASNSAPIADIGYIKLMIINNKYTDNIVIIIDNKNIIIGIILT